MGTADAGLDRTGAVVLFRALSELLRAGAPLDRALTAALDMVPPRSRAAVAGLQARLRLGETLSSALASGRADVPPAATGLVRAGERGRDLHRALDQAAQHMEQQMELAATVRQTLAYPAVLAAAGASALVVLITVVVPRLHGVLTDLGQPVPQVLAAINAMRAFVSTHLPGIVAGGSILIAALVWAGGRGSLPGPARLLEHVPAVGPALRDLAAGRFALALSDLLDAGVRLPEALTFAGQASGSPGLETGAAQARARLLLGESLSGALAATRAIPAAMLAFVRIGEAGGGLSGVCRQAGRLCQASGARRLRTAVSLLEPILILSIALLVGLVAASLLRAVYAIRIPGQ